MSGVPLPTWITLAYYSGWLAILCLTATLSVSPLRALSNRVRQGHGTLRSAAPARRALGIASAVLATLHAFVSASQLHDFSRGGFGWLLDTAFVRWGLTGLLILLALLLTSFPKVVRMVHLRGWKELHRLAYVALACATMHCLLSPFAPRVWILALLAWAACLASLRLVLRLWRS